MTFVYNNLQSAADDDVLRAFIPGGSMGQSLPVEPTTLDTASYHGATFAQDMNMNSFMAQSYPGMYTYPLHS